MRAVNRGNSNSCIFRKLSRFERARPCVVPRDAFLGTGRRCQQAATRRGALPSAAGASVQWMGQTCRTMVPGSWITSPSVSLTSCRKGQRASAAFLDGRSRIRSDQTTRPRAPPAPDRKCAHVPAALVAAAGPSVPCAETESSAIALSEGPGRDADLVLEAPRKMRLSGKSERGADARKVKIVAHQHFLCPFDAAIGD